MKVRRLAQERNRNSSHRLNLDFKAKKKVVTIRERHKVKTASFFFPLSGCGLPQLYAVVEAGYVQIDVGQEQVTCLSVLAEMSHQFTSPPGLKNETSEAGTESSEHAREVPERVVLHQSFDDIRAGCFRYVTASGNKISGRIIGVWSGIERFKEFMAFICNVFHLLETPVTPGLYISIS